MPACNEEAALPGVLAAFRALGSQVPIDVLVVDDGSRDRTAAIARSAGARVVSLSFNLGIGGAVQTGYMYARRRGYEVAVQVDADGQHDPAEISKLLDPIASGSADLVAGTRFHRDSPSYRSSPARRAGAMYFSWLLSAILGRKVTDPSSGFRAAGARAIELFAEQYPTDYPEVDSLVLLWKSGLVSTEVPVRMAQRQGGKSSISWPRAIYYLGKVTLSVGIHLLRRAPVPP